MSNVNINEPLQLIRFREGKFEIPPQTASFLQSFKNPLGIITIVGKYRTGKSLLLNKVLLRNNTFKVSPTINSCTKGLWMCRETLKSDNNQQTDLLVLDTEGFGATEETDQYNQKILLFAILLSSYFIYNSVGSIDENSLNSLNLVAHLARELLKNNNKDEKIDEESPNFLWLLRDFALNLVDKNGAPIQARQYLEQALEIQKGSSDAIENKNKIRRMLKHFFKDRDCYTLVRPVESEQHLQNLLYLPESCFRSQFLEQATILRNKILKKVRAKKIKGKPLDGVLLLELATNYINIINKGDLPNYQLSYKHIIRFQMQRITHQFLSSCRNKINTYSTKLLSKAAIQNIQHEFVKDLQNQFREGSFNAEEVKTVIEGGKKEIHQIMEVFDKQNNKRCVQSCDSIWAGIYSTQREFDNQQQIIEYFDDLLEELVIEMKNQSNPVEDTYLTSIIYKEQIKTLSTFIQKYQKQSNQHLESMEQKNRHLEQLSTHQKQQIQQLQDQNHQLNREINQSNSRLIEIQKVKDIQIGYLKQKQLDNSQQISQLMLRYEDTTKQLQEYRASLLESQTQNQQGNLTLRQVTEDKRLTDRQLQIIRHNIQVKSQEVGELKLHLSEVRTRLESALEKESFILSKHQTEMEHKNNQYTCLSKKNQIQLEQITKLSLQVQQLQKDLDMNLTILQREKNIYQNMFQSFKESLKLEGSSRQELIEANKNLSAALKHLEQRTEQAEQKEKQLKQYKKCVKNSSCLQCQHCTKFFVPSIFLPHLNVCLIGPEALKATKLDIKSSNRPKLEIRIRQTLVKESEGKPFTEYVVEFRREKKEWSINRKYKAFCDLNSALKGALPGVELSQVSYIVNPQEVSKKSLVIEQRRRILQKYLNDLQMNPLVSVTPMWADFIEEPESVSQSLRGSPLKENSRGANQQQTPEQFFKIWNERQMRGKESLSIKGGKWKVG